MVITSPRKIARIVNRQIRHRRMSDNDPMNDMCPCMDEINTMLNNNDRRELRRLTGLDEYEASVIAEKWCSEQRKKRLAHKNPAKVAWKLARCLERMEKLYSMEMGMEAWG